jgi:hypothetical protein
MAENLKLYQQIYQFIEQTGVTLRDVRNLVTFAWAIVGLLLSEQVHLSQWLLFRPSESKAASKERQLSRWLHNYKIQPATIYRNLVVAALMHWREQRVELALDSSLLWERFVVVRVSLIYRGRAVPLAWLVREQASASVSFANYASLLPEVMRLLPAGCNVVLLADRGFADTRLMQLVLDQGWHFAIRLKRSIWVCRPGQPRRKVNSLLPGQGQIALMHQVRITAQQFGPVHLALARVRTPKGYQSWAVVSDRPTSLETFDEYGLRFDIEENFLDDKSAGFQLESTEIEDAAALSRLCLILATATLYLVSTGTAVVAWQRRHWIDTHWQRGLSYLQLGWRWVRRALLDGLPLLSFPWLLPGPDPEPVFASKRQAATPTLRFSSIFMLE